jgi:hypothetical protein
MRTIHLSSVKRFSVLLKGDSGAHRGNSLPDAAGFTAFAPLFARYNQRKLQNSMKKHMRKYKRCVMATKQTRLEKVIAAWPTLPAHIKAAIQDIIRANTIYQNSWVLWPGRVSRLHGDDRDHEQSQPAVDDVTLKRCTKCKQWKNESQFYKNRRSKDGLRSRCKKCSSKAAKKYRRKKQIVKT